MRLTPEGKYPGQRFVYNYMMVVEEDLRTGEADEVVKGDVQTT